MTPLINFTTNVDLTNYTVIIPSVSVGNVGQLTVDLIVTTYNFKKIGTIWHPALISSVGGDPYFNNSNDVCTACEIYCNEDLKVALIQLRSGIELPLALSFFREVKTSLINLKVKNVVILTSSFAHEMHTIGSGFFKYITNEDTVDEIFKGLNIAPVEPSLNGRYLIHGSGYAVKLCEVLSAEIKCTLIMKYTSEGDNRPDAMSLLSVLQKIVDFNSNNLDNIVFPTSWNYVYGNPPPLELY